MVWEWRADDSSSVAAPGPDVTNPSDATALLADCHVACSSTVTLQKQHNYIKSSVCLF